MSIRSTRICNVSIVNVANEKKQKSCISRYKYEDERVSLPKPKSQLAQLHGDDETYLQQV